jgi:hypothetical protein
MLENTQHLHLRLSGLQVTLAFVLSVNKESFQDLVFGGGCSFAYPVIYLAQSC